MTGRGKLWEKLSNVIVLSDNFFYFSNLSILRYEINCLDRLLDFQSNRHHGTFTFVPYFPRKVTETDSSDVNCICLKSNSLAQN